MEQHFVANNAHPIKDNFITRWQAPSNIALIKYWGKTTPQLPKNASLSFTLTHAVTQTQVEFKPLENPTEKVTFSIIFEGEEKSSFRPKLEDFFANILPYQPFLAHYKLTITSQNTFPHSSGIASSASSIRAGCIADLLKSKYLTDETFLPYQRYGPRPEQWAQHARRSACPSLARTARGRRPSSLKFRAYHCP